MTTKEEAEKLVHKYRMILMNEDTDCGHEILCTEIAKKLALKSCDESLLLLENIESKINDSLIYNLKLRYNKIRTEVKNI